MRPWYESGKPDPREEIHYGRVVGPNASEACKLENMTYAKVYLPWRRCRAKCARGVCWETRLAPRYILHGGKAKPNALEVCEMGNPTHVKVYPPRRRHKAKCAREA